ncbi:hypothetical protein [Streptomyces sp. Ag109_G2-15]|uniref:hypothetical protein n=1 Tax=Streptomyces sp. Ag109_G2-15 TaxID=1938850 RepID=UPI000BE359BD|nr:hypothetical protein [Streptomyces sp. Ag109_G2-15]
MTTPDADTPSYPVPVDAGRRMVDPAHDGGGVELFPVNFTSYQHDLLPDLDTETHVRAIADLLAPTASSPGGNTVLYWVGHGSARHLAHHQTRSPITCGVTPRDIAEAIGIRQRHPANDGSWAVVVLDAGFSKNFARAVHSELFAHPDEAVRYLLLSTAAEGYTELGAFTQALDQALHTTFPIQRAIGLSALGRALASRLGGFVDDLTIDDNRDQLVRLIPTAAAAVSAPLDELAELQSVIDQLPVDEQRHFLPKGVRCRTRRIGLVLPRPHHPTRRDPSLAAHRHQRCLDRHRPRRRR